MNKDIKTLLQSDICGFSSGSLSQNAIRLFSTLGYNTDRQDPFPQKTFAYFKESFLDGQIRFNEDKALVREWKTVDLLFQLTQEELSDGTTLFDTKKVDNTVIETYLFFAIELTKESYTRTALAQITREINKVFPMPVMIVFRYGKYLTLSVINRRLHKKDEQKDVLEKVTLIKDISVEKPHRAHIEILSDLSYEELKRVHKFSNFVELHNAWQKTLDTKELNKRFYQELSNWYFRATEHVSFPDDVEKDKNIRNATSLIRLITRIIFIWFIKEKQLVPDTLFDPEELSRILKEFAKNDESHSYYQAILQNLFFGTLNQKMDERGFAKQGSFEENKQNYGVKNLFRYADQFAVSPEEAIALFKDIPFLNGGLFDCLDKENDDGKVLYADGFSRNPKKQAIVPDFLFFHAEEECDLNAVYGTKNKKYKVKGLFDILSAYKFTITENTPIEEEIALDPELLGKVFENLLASYNPETQTTARKQTGSFYTPREIVNYMVDESIKAYLKQKLETEAGMKPEDAEAGLDLLLGYNDREHLFDKQQTAVLIKAIDNCKILDPACGSGAFPMGVLHKMVYCLYKLDPNNENWREIQRQKAIKETEEAFRIGNKQEREERLIEISDIFENNSDDYGRKLYLIENCIYGVDIQPIAIQISKLRFFISLIVDQKVNHRKDNFGIRALPNLETKFVAANTLIGLDKPEQRGLKNPKIEELEGDLKQLRHQYFNAKTRKEKSDYQKKDRQLRQEIAQLLIQDKWGSKEAEQMANFDPYDQNAKSPFFDMEWMFGIKDGFDVVIGNPPYVPGKNLGVEQKKYFKIKFKYLIGKYDLYLIFIEKSLELVTYSGKICFIVPNTFLVNENAQLLREALIKNNYADILKIYDNLVFEASVESLVIILGRNKNSHIQVFNSINELFLNLPYAEILQDSFFRFQIALDVENKNIIDKIEKNSIKLGDISEICIGIQIGGNGLSSEFKSNHISKSPNSNSYKKVLDGKEFEPYITNWQGNYIHYGDWLHRKRDEKFFINPKIIIRQIGNTPIANLDYNGYYTLNTIYNVILKDDSNQSLKLIFTLINSKLLKYYWLNKFSDRKSLFPKIKKSQLVEIPIKNIPFENQKRLIALVDQIFAIKQKNPKSDITTLERKIDEMLYQLYELTDEEIAIVEGEK